MNNNLENTNCGLPKAIKNLENVSKLIMETIDIIENELENHNLGNIFSDDIQTHDDIWHILNKYHHLITDIENVVKIRQNERKYYCEECDCNHSFQDK